MLKHLIELRQRGLWVILTFFGFFVVFFVYASPLLSILLKPLLAHLPENTTLIAIHPTSSFFIPLKLAFHLSLLASMPILLYHIWSFAAPGLYGAEQSWFKQALFLSECLFILGLIFCYFLFLPYLLHFLSHHLPEEIKLLPDIAATMDFITQMMLAFGLCFQVPLVCFVLVQFKLCTLNSLIQFRPYVIVAAFVLGMILTPPDVISQIGLALPMLLLFELGLLLCRFAQRA